MLVPTKQDPNREKELKRIKEEKKARDSAGTSKPRQGV